ncbi:ATP-dependent DNA helicase DinG [Kineococcus radiotolerans]|uniref:ATP-dependent helicase DinG n=1 Tax=Kineococcus radiotolerans TaxID=131568 RepID=A0A7W4TJ09_KINRA|nr:ATP-dependent DNA helicase [Kineococcus radiotolerans]MBB2899804.1 ATP-dependent DNA helicase DinG [Kineococcus radiotolerans]
MSARTGTPVETADEGTDGDVDGHAATGVDEVTDEVAEPEVAELLDAVVGALGGQRREGQATMARAVTDAIRSRRHLLVQAGTGTGKSMAYLVPAVAHAVHAGRAVVVTTATLALQAQVVERDLPRLAKAIAPRLHREPTWELLKGRSNYLCRNKLDGGFPSDEGTLFDVAGPSSGADAGGEGRLGREVVRLREWAESTSTGDRDELDPGVSDRAWRQVSVSARECLGSQRCPVAAECFSERVRARARTVDVVVTNHAMTAIDALESSGQLLPEHDVLVVDEAHELADRVTAVATAELSATGVHAASRRLRRSAGIVSDGLDDAAVALEAALEEAPPGRLDRWPDRLADAVVAVRDAARTALSDLKDAGEAAGKEEDPEARGARHLARAAVQEVFSVAERLAEDVGRGAGDGFDVAWVTAGAGPAARPPSLHIAPLSVAGLLREKLFAERTVVATSATLTLGGSFDPVAGAFGLKGAKGAGTRWAGVDVGSPFDYPRQGILHIARHLPPPGRAGASEAVLDELATLVEAAGGRTLGLFSSRRAAEEAAEALRQRLSTPVLCQGEDRLPKLVRAFTDDPATSLFGTMSLWQGVDVPGPSCSLVVIDRIPFPRPDDPLMSARARAVDAAGGNGFVSVSAAHAAVRLAQGAGRLIRATGDRGVVAVLDSRLATARYGGFLRDSLPDFWPTTSTATVVEALRRLSAV